MQVTDHKTDWQVPPTPELPSGWIMENPVEPFGALFLRERYDLEPEQPVSKSFMVRTETGELVRATTDVVPAKTFFAVNQQGRCQPVQNVNLRTNRDLRWWLMTP